MFKIPGDTKSYNIEVEKTQLGNIYTHIWFEIDWWKTEERIFNEAIRMAKSHADINGQDPGIEYEPFRMDRKQNVVTLKQLSPKYKSMTQGNIEGFIPFKL